MVIPLILAGVKSMIVIYEEQLSLPAEIDERNANPFGTNGLDDSASMPNRKNRLPIRKFHRISTGYSTDIVPGRMGLGGQSIVRSSDFYFVYVLLKQQKEMPIMTDLDWEHYQRTVGIDPLTTIYFIHAPDVNRIKIGYAYNHWRRFKGISTSSPIEIEGIGVIRGDRVVENAIHRRFAHLRYRFEWFDFKPELQNFVRDLSSPWEGSDLNAWYCGLIRLPPTMRHQFIEMVIRVVERWRPGTSLHQDRIDWSAGLPNLEVWGVGLQRALADRGLIERNPEPFILDPMVRDELKPKPKPKPEPEPEEEEGEPGWFSTIDRHRTEKNDGRRRCIRRPKSS